MIKVTINYHSAVDVITNSSTELFCEITSKDFMPLIQAGLGSVLGHEVEVYPTVEDIEKYPEDYAEKSPSIQFAIEYGDNEQLCDDFCALLNNYLTNLVGRGNFNINRDASY